MNNFIGGIKNAAEHYQQSGDVPSEVATPGRAAGDYTPTGSVPQQAWDAVHGGQGGGHGSHDSVDWSNLSNLAGVFGSAEEKHGSEGLDISKFTSFLGGGGGDQTANPAQAAAKQGADPKVVDKLLNFYHEKTGKTFQQGDGKPDGNFDELTQMAAHQLGINVPTPILKKMIKWKLQGMF
ncbi:hypothetical protein WJX73_006421 [Symbiochloris irregularis]|uniref:Uncharacterized protein n=1 Tax=Symbiochloris irregularis TaxID=706552 RepID=A0AAW1PM88_9CHLO